MASCEDEWSGDLYVSVFVVAVSDPYSLALQVLTEKMAEARARPGEAGSWP